MAGPDRAPYNQSVSAERYAYTQPPRANAAPAASRGVSAPAGATAVVALVAMFAAGLHFFPEAVPGDVPGAEGGTTITETTVLPERTLITAERPASSPLPVAADGFVDKGADMVPVAPPPTPTVTMSPGQVPAPQAVSILQRGNGGFVPWDAPKKSVRRTTRQMLLVPGGVVAGAGAAPGTGMGTAVTACEELEFAEKAAAGRSLHYRSSGAKYGPSVAKYGPSVAGYGPSVAAYGSSGAGYGNSVAAFASSGAGYGASVASFASSGAGYGPSVASFASSGAGYAAPAPAANCGACAK